MSSFAAHLVLAGRSAPLTAKDCGGYFDGDPATYARERDAVHHEHDSHHHDLELLGRATRLTHGPLDPNGGAV